MGKEGVTGHQLEVEWRAPGTATLPMAPALSHCQKKWIAALGDCRHIEIGILLAASIVRQPLSSGLKRPWKPLT
jgi:hypothetical protein